jgi:energy-coupling factor transporter ATP-binding protein EcfA2
MQETGTFSQSTDGRLWYVDKTMGRPILIDNRSDQLDTLLDLRYSLNQTEQEQRYVTAGLCNYTAGLPPTSVATAMSYYNETAKVLYIHTGRKDVVRVRAQGLDTISNGEDGVIFPWGTNQDLYTPNYDPLDKPWYELMFRQSVCNLVSMPQEQAITLLRVWVIFLLFRHAAISRPILAILGAPGSGKSTLFRKIYALLYGGNRSVGAVTTPDNFDYSSANDAFVALDNVDTYEKWLPDRLALSASTSDITKRKLYTNSDIVVLRRQALVGVTAHAPKFGREDVADRMLLINLERLEHFEAEGAIIKRVLENRSQIWGSILQDCQQVLAGPQPNESRIPQFRVEDFARLGYWIAQGLGIESSFVQAIASIKVGQHAFSLDKDSLIVSAILSFVQKSKRVNEWIPQAAMWDILETYSGDPPEFKKQYRNAQELSNKMWVLQDSLKQVITIESEVDPNKGSRIWLLGAKDGTS